MTLIKSFACANAEPSSRWNSALPRLPAGSHPENLLLLNTFNPANIWDVSYWYRLKNLCIEAFTFKYYSNIYIY